MTTTRQKVSVRILAFLRRRTSVHRAEIRDALSSSMGKHENYIDEVLRDLVNRQAVSLDGGIATLTGFEPTLETPLGLEFRNQHVQRIKEAMTEFVARNGPDPVVEAVMSHCAALDSDYREKVNVIRDRAQRRAQIVMEL